MLYLWGEVGKADHLACMQRLASEIALGRIWRSNLRVGPGFFVCVRCRKKNGIQG